MSCRLHWFVVPYARRIVRWAVSHCLATSLTHSDSPLPFVYSLQITLVTFGWVKALWGLWAAPALRTVPVADDPSHRVHSDYKGRLVQTPHEGVATLYDLLMDALARYGDNNCMAQRVFLGWKVPHKVKHFDDTILWRTYRQVADEAHKFGAALRAAGLVPAPPTTDLDKVKTPW